MPDSNDVLKAQEEAALVLGGTARSGSAGKLQQAENQFLTSEFIDLYAKITLHLPPSRERSLTLTKLEEAKMWAIKAVFAEEKN